MSYRLNYVNARGRAELVRLIFAQAEQDYEDHRTPIEDVLEERNKSPYGILPTLIVGGDTVLSGNATIARYLAEKYGLAGSDDLQNAEIYGIVNATEYIWEQISLYFYETDPQRKQENGKKLFEKVLPFCLAKLERTAASNPNGWMYGDKVTYADFAIFVLVDIINNHGISVMDKFPSLFSVFEKVKVIPNIAKWLSIRPQTPN